MIFIYLRVACMGGTVGGTYQQEIGPLLPATSNLPESVNISIKAILVQTRFYFSKEFQILEIYYS